MSIHIFGIRHHGPGCASSLRAVLDELQPDAIVMEGPADAQDALPLAAHEEMTPPVAMLIYPPTKPRYAVYFPLTVFSPEWQTLRWAAEHNVSVTLMDLPLTHQLAQQIADDEEDQEDQEEIEEQQEQDESASVADPNDTGTPPVDDLPSPDVDSESPPENTPPTELTWRTDPLALLAEAAGYRDHELWWEEQIERRKDATQLFEAIAEAMRVVREEVYEPRERDLLREAFMRKTIRDVQKAGHEKIAIVCGAWHAPVLDEEALAGKREGLRAKDDNAKLKGLPKVKTTTTWIPWTHSRLSYSSGYGAGVQSPGWYSHLWNTGDDASTRWIITAARLLREKDLDASSASAIEAIRLADALAALRDLRAPGLVELNEAIQSVLCHGEPAPMRLIRWQLEIGNVLGSVPDETPSVPLAQDLAKQQKSLRLKPSTENKLVDLDLRKPNDLSRSQLLHQLNLLEIPWGQKERSGGGSSTFHEVWRIEWKPEFAVAIIEANVWGNNVVDAATARVIHDANESNALAHVTELLNQVMLAGLIHAVEPLLNQVHAMAAVGTDVRHMMDALPPLARLARYGDVRNMPADQVEPILVGLFERALVGLKPACSSLDDDAAERMLTSIGNVHEALELFVRDELIAEWHTCLRDLMQSDVHPLLRGWCCRLLLEQGVLDDGELERLARLGMSIANPPAESAAWTTGLLRGSGLLLIHQDTVWSVLNRWISSLNADTFVEMLPLLRRAFADFTSPERRQMGDKVKHLGTDTTTSRPATQSAGDTNTLNLERGRKVLPILAHILGVEYHDNQQ